MGHRLNIIADLLSGRIHNTLLRLKRQVRLEEDSPLYGKVKGLTGEMKVMAESINRQEQELDTALARLGDTVTKLVENINTEFDRLKLELARREVAPDLTDEIQSVNAAVERLGDLGKGLTEGGGMEAAGVVVGTGDEPTSTGGAQEATVLNAGQGETGPTDRPETGAPGGSVGLGAGGPAVSEGPSDAGAGSTATPQSGATSSESGGASADSESTATE